MLIMQLVVRPQGDWAHEEIVAEVEIVNDQTGDQSVGNYTYVIQSYDRRPGAQEILRSGRIEGINRTRSALHVLAEVLDKENLEL